MLAGRREFLPRPQLGCSPAPHIPALTGLELHQQGYSWGHGLAWLWASPRALPRAEAVAARVPPAALLLAGGWNGAWLPSHSLMDSYGTPQPQGVLGPKWHPDSGSWSFLENFSPLSAVLLPKDSVTKSLLGMHGRKMNGKLRVGKKVICFAFSTQLHICL